MVLYQLEDLLRIKGFGFRDYIQSRLSTLIRKFGDVFYAAAFKV